MKIKAINIESYTVQLVFMFRNLITIVFTGILLSYSSNAYSQAESNPPPNVNQPVSVQEDPQNQLGLIYTVKKLDEAKKFIEDGNYGEAEKILTEAKNWLTDATEFHYNLFQAFNRQQKNIGLAKIEKAHAADFGHVRDQSYFLLAKIYIGQNKLREAANMLVEIIKSQSGSILSEQAYKTLQEIKFSDKTK